MSASGFRFWRIWLVTAAAGMTAFGVFMALASSTSVFEAFNQRIDPVFWGAAKLPPAAIEFRGWIYATWGATVAGLGLLVAMVAHHAYARREAWSRNSLAAVLITWYLLDTGASLAWGVTFNAAFNTAVALVLGLPLGLTWRAFFSDQETVQG